MSMLERGKSATKRACFPRKEVMNLGKKNSMSFGPKYFFVVGGCIVWICIVHTILYNPYNRTVLAQKSR
jgi:hypothetical protein